MKIGKRSGIILVALFIIMALTLAACSNPVETCKGEHTFGQWTVTKAATCVAEGSKTRTCSVCGYTETEKVAATGSHTYGEWTVTKAATCTEEGSRTRTCTASGCTASETEVIPVQEHSFGTEYKFDVASHWKECACGEKEAASAHTFGSWTVKKAAVCGTDGLEAHACTVCGYEETRTVAAPASHVYGAWTTVTEPTCGVSGTKQRTCTVCGEIETDIIPATGDHVHKDAENCTDYPVCEVCGTVLRKPIGHDLECNVTTPATTTTEGEATVRCLRVGCDYTATLKVLMLPTVSYSGTTLSWTAVENATGYKVYVDGVATDLGNRLTYVLPADASEHTYEVAAYTDNEEYYPESAYALTLSYGENMQAEKNYNFEREVSSVIRLDRTASWNAYPYGNWSDTNGGVGGWYYICPDETGNMVAKVPAVIWFPGNTTLKKDLGPACRETNTTYEISFDVKISERAMELVNGSGNHGKLCGYMWGDGLIALSYGAANFSGEGLALDAIGNAEEWHNIRVRYTVGESAPSYIQFNLIYWPEGAVGEDNYVLVDNIEVYKVVDGGAVGNNVDGIAGGDFEMFSQTVFTANKWYLDETLLIERSAIGSTMEKEGDNTVFRAYTSGREVAFDMKGNLELAEVGNYKMTMKVKLGPDATNITSMGFCAWAWNGGDAFRLVDPAFFALDTLSDSEWVTVTTYFTSKGLENTTAINLYFFASTNNDVIRSEDNYILFDDIIVTKLDVE